MQRIVGLLLIVSVSCSAQATCSAAGSLTAFQMAMAGSTQIKNWVFGTGSGSTVTNLTQLATDWNPYTGLDGTTVINNEWERYQTFNTTNFVFTTNSLNLTGTIPSGGGLFAGGINSGQIASNFTFVPGVTGYNTYSVEVIAQVPGARGAWPAIWETSNCPSGGSCSPSGSDGSEIDVEFFETSSLPCYGCQWTGFMHGPYVGSYVYTIVPMGTSPSNQQPYWEPGPDFSAAYHAYQMVWTTSVVSKYVDGTLVQETNFAYGGSEGYAQIILNLAIGSSTVDSGALEPNSLGEFPMTFSIQRVTIWGK